MRHLLLSGFFIALCSSLQAQRADTLDVTQLYQLLQPAQVLPAAQQELTRWGHPGMLSSQQDSAAGVLSLAGQAQAGDYRRLRQPGSSQQLSVATAGYRTGKRLAARGSMRYDRAFWQNHRLANRWQPYDGNPYMLGDCVSTEWLRQRFEVTGSLGVRLRQRWFVAADAQYVVGIAAKQKDPRSLIRYNHLLNRLAITYQAPAGLTAHVWGGFGFGREELGISTLTGNPERPVWDMRSVATADRRLLSGLTRTTTRLDQQAGLHLQHGAAHLQVRYVGFLMQNGENISLEESAGDYLQQGVEAAVLQRLALPSWGLQGYLMLSYGQHEGRGFDPAFGAVGHVWQNQTLLLNTPLPLGVNAFYRRQATDIADQPYVEFSMARTTLGLNRTQELFPRAGLRRSLVLTAEYWLPEESTLVETQPAESYGWLAHEPRYFAQRALAADAQLLYELLANSAIFGVRLQCTYIQVLSDDLNPTEAAAFQNRWNSQAALYYRF